jgi:hypothetical protein
VDMYAHPEMPRVSGDVHMGKPVDQRGTAVISPPSG